MKKSLVAIILIIVILSTSITGVFAAGCGNWTIYATGEAYCHDVWCNNLVSWFGDSWGQSIYEKRQCVRSDNTTYWEANSYTKWNGCC